MFGGELGDFMDIWKEGLKTIISSKFLLLLPLCFQFFFFHIMS